MKGRDITKRTFDLVVGLPLLVLAVPLLVVGAGCSAVALRAWPFFAHRRVGRNGETFTFVKLRTLPRQVPPYADKHELGNYQIPMLCRMLRRLHLDELPQLFHVVTGKMSLVGPRPEMAYLHDTHFDLVFAEMRTSVRPGCTGLWQISEHCTDMIYEHPEFDEEYLTSRTLRLDLWIMLHTVRLLLPVRDRRLVSLNDLPSWAVRDVVLDEPGAESQLSAAEA
jgi:lipopolysaccharide/colanic/teichoic acid biosynthesis glycosyltransferase